MQIYPILPYDSNEFNCEMGRSKQIVNERTLAESILRSGRRMTARSRISSVRRNMERSGSEVETHGGQ